MKTRLSASLTRRASRLRLLVTGAVAVCASHAAVAGTPNSADFAVGGIKLGMTFTQAEAALRAEVPPLEIRRVVSRAGDNPNSSTYVAALVGEHRVAGAITADDNQEIVLFTRITGKVYEVVKSRDYGGKLHVDALKNAVEQQYGLQLHDSMTGMPSFGLTGRADYDKEGKQTTDANCTSVDPDELASSLLYRRSPADVYILRKYATGCGVLLKIVAQLKTGNNIAEYTPLVLSVYQFLYNQDARAEDAVASRAADAAAAEKAAKDADRAAQEKPHL